MSSSSSLGEQQQEQKKEAPWRSLFLEHVQGMASPEFTLATVRRVRSGSGSGSATYAPRARTCIFRGLFAELPVNPKNEAELNPAGVYASDLLTFTTDARMDKLPELFGDGVEDDVVRGTTGGGGPVEATFWARQAAVQWRVRGRAYVLAPDVEDGDNDRAAAVRALLRARMRKPGKEKEKENDKEWSFAREITAHFGNLAPLMRGTFRNPPPGAPVALPVGDDRLAPGQEVSDLADEVARAHFRVVVVVPDEVDRADLSDPRRGRRWLYTFVGPGGRQREPSRPGGVVEDGWEIVEVWP